MPWPWSCVMWVFFSQCREFLLDPIFSSTLTGAHGCSRHCQVSDSNETTAHYICEHVRNIWVCHPRFSTNPPCLFFCPLVLIGNVSKHSENQLAQDTMWNLTFSYSFPASRPKNKRPNTSPGHRRAAPCVAAWGVLSLICWFEFHCLWFGELGNMVYIPYIPLIGDCQVIFLLINKFNTYMWRLCPPKNPKSWLLWKITC